MSNPSICCITTGPPYNQSRYIALAMSRIWPGDVITKELGETLPECNYYFWTDSGCCHRIETSKEKTIFYAIDSHIRNDHDQWYLEIGRNCKYVFDATTNGDGIGWFAANGITAHNMPLAYSQDYFWYENLPNKYDVLWCGGRQHDGLRGQILDVVRKSFKLSEFDSHSNPFIYNDSLRTAINSSRVVLEISPLEGNYFGQRFWENLGCQSNCVSLDRPIVREMFSPPDVCGPVLFSNPDNAVDMIHYALGCRLEKKHWGDITKHTYDQRLKDYFLPIVLE